MKTAFVIGGGFFMAWLTVESIFKPCLDRHRATVPEEDKAPCTGPDAEERNIVVSAVV